MVAEDGGSPVRLDRNRSQEEESNAQNVSVINRPAQGGSLAGARFDEDPYISNMRNVNFSRTSNARESEAPA